MIGLIERRDSLRRELVALSAKARTLHASMHTVGTYLAPYIDYAEPELGEGGGRTIQDRDYPSLEEVNALISEISNKRNELANVCEQLRQMGV